ncbi:putative serine protease PepD [Microdochium nivale]|nr:putative serine protease PepD [Microdochium nivale]
MSSTHDSTPQAMEAYRQSVPGAAQSAHDHEYNAQHAPMVVNHEQGYQYADYPQALEYSQKEAVYQQQWGEVYPEHVAATPVSAGVLSPPPPGYFELGQNKEGGAVLANMPEGRKATICGLRRRTFWVAAVVVAVVLIGAIVGGVVGGIAARKGNPTDGSNVPEAAPKPNATDLAPAFPAVLKGSKIAASNWTGSDNFARRAVFFQDEHNSIVACLWDQQNSTWLTHNVTDILRSRKIEIDIAPAKSLASAALDTVNAFGPRLWYIDSKNVVRRVQSAVYDVKEEPDSWTPDTPGSFSHQIWPDSQIAVAWQRCAPNCVGDWILAYQRNSDGAIMTANNSHWNNPDMAMDAEAVGKSTALALVPWYQTVANKMGLTSETRTSSGRPSMQLYEFNGTRWGSTGPPLLKEIIPSAASETQFAITKWRNWGQTLYLSLTSDGVLSASWWNNSPQTAINIDLAGLPGGGAAPRLTAISLSLDAMFYGIAEDGRVLEFAVDQDVPGRFNYRSTIWPPQSTTEEG